MLEKPRSSVGTVVFRHSLTVGYDYMGVPKWNGRNEIVALNCHQHCGNNDHSEHSQGVHTGANRSMSRKDQIRCCFPYIINKSGVLMNRDRDRERWGELAIGNCSPHFIVILKSINGHKAH